MFKLPSNFREDEQHKAVNLTWVVVILTLVALLEGIQRGGLLVAT